MSPWILHRMSLLSFSFLLDKRHEAENLQKECLFLLHYHFPMEDSSESYIGIFSKKDDKSCDVE